MQLKKVGDLVHMLSAHFDVASQSVLKTAATKGRDKHIQAPASSLECIQLEPSVQKKQSD